MASVYQDWPMRAAQGLSSIFCQTSSKSAPLKHRATDNPPMNPNAEHFTSKVPEVTLGFWIIKILATTLGETGGDAVTMTWLKADVMANAGYLIGSAIFLSVFLVLVAIQISAK